MKIRTQIRAGGGRQNHSAQPQAVKVKTRVRAGKIVLNHSVRVSGKRVRGGVASTTSVRAGFVIKGNNG